MAAPGGGGDGAGPESSTDDYLDAKGEGVNFLTGAPFTPEYARLAAAWSALPMYRDHEMLASLVASVRDSSVTIVISGTGSGKTVIVPKVAAKVLRGKVAITNPKTTTTQANADYAAKCMDVALGYEVGYHFRGSPASARGKRTRLLYLTDGMLLAQARKDPMLREFSCVIIDEAHERPTPVDFLLQTSISILKARPEFRLIVMSATIDAELFSRYFSDRGVSVRTLHAQGAPRHPVEHVYVSEKDAPGILNRIVGPGPGEGDGGPGGDVLWFVATSADAAQGCKTFDKACTAPDCAAMMCTELYSKASEEAKSASLLPPPDPFLRKVIFATNIAESSFTFPGLGYVVDSGLELSSRWDAARRCTVITRRMTSQAQITQREGRVGRVGPGKVYHLYSEEKRKALKQFPDPNIVGVDLTSEVLAMLTRHTIAETVAACQDMLTPPLPAQVASALALLHFYRMIDVRRPSSPEAVHFYDAKWSEVATLAEIPQRFEGGITPLGAALYGAATGAKLSPWNALLPVIGAVVGRLDEPFKLACVLEEVVADPRAMFPVLDKHNNNNKNVVPSMAPALIAARTQAQGGCSDHAMLLRVFDMAADPLVDADKFGDETGMSLPFWRRVVARATDARAAETKRVIEKAVAAVLAEEEAAGVVGAAKTWASAYAGIDLAGEGYKDDTDLLRVLLLSRLYQFVKECEEGGRKEESHLAFSDKCAKVKVEHLVPCSGTEDSGKSRSVVAESFVDATNDGTLAAVVVTDFEFKKILI